MKNVIITGANSGLGFETAKKIAGNKEYRIILACRNEEKALKAKEEIIRETGNENIETLKLDTSLLSSVKNFAEAYIDKYGTVDVLINNAGISPMAASGKTAEGFEVVFATNFLGHFLLTNLLLSHLNDGARIINVSSDMHNPPGGISWKGMDYLAYEAVDDRQRYSHSKLCMIYFTHKLDEIFRLEKSSFTANSFNPGYMAATNFSGGTADKARSLVVRTTMPERYGELESSSDALAQIATDENFSNVSGQYFDRSINTRESSELSYSVGNADELWNKSLEYCGMK